MTNRVALVTGGAGGVGSVICRRLATDGFDVVVGHHRSVDAAATVVDECRSAGVRAEAVAADLADASAARSLVEQTVERLGGFDVLVHCAATATFAPLTKLAGAKYDAAVRTVGVNTLSLMVLLAACAEHMRDGGRIVGISSLAAGEGYFGGAAYAATKAANEALVRVAARELGGRGITSSSIRLGLVDTPSAREVTPDGVWDFYAMQSAVRRTGTPDDVASAVSHLVAPDSAWLTGATITLDGGARL